MCGCEATFTCARCADANPWDQPGYVDWYELDKLRADRALSTVDFETPFKEAA